MAQYEADLENIPNLENPETPFLLKDLKTTINLLKNSIFPEKELEQLKLLTEEFNLVVQEIIRKSRMEKQSRQEISSWM